MKKENTRSEVVSNTSLLRSCVAEPKNGVKNEKPTQISENPQIGEYNDNRVNDCRRVEWKS